MQSKAKVQSALDCHIAKKKRSAQVANKCHSKTGEGWALDLTIARRLENWYSKNCSMQICKCATDPHFRIRRVPAWWILAHFRRMNVIREKTEWLPVWFCVRCLQGKLLDVMLQEQGQGQHAYSRHVCSV
ncbi:hypothetical protein HBH56_113620 [Parastagonospora nodorum]|uniref:Uncharacterized protein n=1 Tax=Phaeosphaeria nodorum (strain SN15 / ATCC MYA-4574 / FGSC 10173) TaxID=321614 RepID=A0A7U2I7W3_PHANO|nr:hypothetical protein HBH56_113620 [Parastagonospora nodorum]QRD03607.1 hypothetical protein JI435_419970 [Parastagonospora nodorum SN15]KAH3921481.1 hypothetical protein HBH54_238800 [Parastagonospora nodorum]KAH3979300.1 hypothetical protein HBH52_096900 [Parastagonospora nodorum]KAH3999727.1 hypothetical protein HBI10_116480 [Parastagonospora nodorum]